MLARKVCKGKGALFACEVVEGACGRRKIGRHCGGGSELHKAIADDSVYNEQRDGKRDIDLEQAQKKRREGRKSLGTLTCSADLAIL